MVDELEHDAGRDAAPDPDAPVGLHAAAQAHAVEVDAVPDDGAGAPPGEGAGEPPPLDIDCSSLARLTLEMVLASLERRHECWHASERELDCLSKAWGRWMESMMQAPTPFAQALLVTGVFAAPRAFVLVLERKARRAQEAGVAAEDRAGGQRAGEEPLAQGVG